MHPSRVIDRLAMTSSNLRFISDQCMPEDNTIRMNVVALTTRIDVIINVLRGSTPHIRVKPIWFKECQLKTRQCEDEKMTPLWLERRNGILKCLNYLLAYMREVVTVGDCITLASLMVDEPLCWLDMASNTIEGILHDMVQSELFD